MMGKHRLDLRTWLHEGAIEASGNYRLQMGRKQIIKHTSRKCGLADNYQKVLFTACLMSTPDQCSIM